jgi:tetratricopeptide (TPR) repeat protein
LLSVASCLVTLAVQRQVVNSMEWVRFSWRLINAVLSLLAYIYEMFWPTKLAPFYPYPFGSLSIWRLAGTILILCVITAGVFVLRKRYPYGITGWFWYLGMLVPVIGIVQVGSQARADRYTYLPHIGLYLAMTWAVSDLSVSWRHRRVILAIGAVIILVVLACTARLQTSYWENSESLWIRTLAVTSNNATAHYNLGGAFLEKGFVDKAIFHDRKALELRPNYTGAHNGLGRALFEKGDVDEAIEQWQKTLSISPDDPDAHTALGDAMLRKQRIGDAIAHYERSLQIAPESAPTLNALAWVLAVSADVRFRNGARAVELARRADGLAQGKDPILARTLAAAYAESGRFNDAIAAAERARAVAIRQGDSPLAEDLRMEIDLYRVNFPLRARPSE